MKKILIALGVLAVVGVGAFMVFNRLSANVEAEVRTFIETLPNMTEKKLGAVTYSSTSNTITLTDLRLSGVLPNGAPVTLSLASVEVVNPNKALLGKNPPTAPDTPLADSVTIKDYVASTSGVTARVQQMTTKNLRGDVRYAFLAFSSTNLAAPDMQKIFTSYSVGEMTCTGLTFDAAVPGQPSATIAVATFSASNVGGGKLGAVQMTDIKIVADKETVTFGAFKMANLTIPDFSKLTPEEFQAIMTQNPAGMAALNKKLPDMLPKGTPLVGLMAFEKFAMSALPGVTLGSVELADVVLTPPSLSLSVKNLSFPTAMLPAKEVAELGYTTVVLSGEFSLKQPSPDRDRLIVGLTLADGGSVRVTADMLPLKGDISQTSPEAFVRREIISLEALYADTGLMGRIATYVQKNMGMPVEAQLGMAQQAVTGIFSAQKPNADAVLAVLKNPGELQAIMTFPKPVPVMELESALQDLSLLKLTAKPGPKTLQATMPK